MAFDAYITTTQLPFPPLDAWQRFVLGDFDSLIVFFRTILTDAYLKSARPLLLFIVHSNPYNIVSENILKM